MYSILFSLPLALGDTLLDKYFCGKYYPPAGTQGLPPCHDVRSAVVSNLTRPLPTLELGDASKPALFFVHGWPDSAAEFAAQFGGLCYGPDAIYRCVAVTWQNFHPDLPNSPDEDLEFAIAIDKVAATMMEVDMVNTTLVIHDWGSFIGYQLMWKFPHLMQRTISFDIGSGGHPNTAYQKVNANGFLTHNSAVTESVAAHYWWAPCVECATWRTAWPYERYSGGYHSRPPATYPLLFIWGNMTRGQPRTADTKFFDEKWLDFVISTPHGKVVEGSGDHWIFHEKAQFVNHVMKQWLDQFSLRPQYRYR
ncbi:hypothetical protein AB1Y20_003104 [Prymnesium parvum]|uniref:AB hydrolase-1 domain-containing protein n=1 Tax=Prymnesium parvum TaxID=97485 RepID=A0AB34JDL7_PRYPA